MTIIRSCPLIQLEDLGFCEKGEGPEFIRRHTLHHRGFVSHQYQRRTAVGGPGRLRRRISRTGRIHSTTDRPQPRALRSAKRASAMAVGFGMITYDRGLCSRCGRSGPGRRMIPPLSRPKRKNPILRTRQPLLPPCGALARGARLDRRRCARPVRTAGVRATAAPSSIRRAKPATAVCPIGCAGASKPAGRTDRRDDRASQPGSVLSRARAVANGHGAARCGPTLITHLHGAGAPPPSRVRVGARLDKSGQGVLVAFPIDEVITMVDDRQLREMTCDPKGPQGAGHRRQDGRGPGRARAIMLAAGADPSLGGPCQAWNRYPGCAELAALPRVAMRRSI